MGAGGLKRRFEVPPPWPPVKIHRLGPTESAFLTSIPDDSNADDLRTSLREKNKFHEVGTPLWQGWGKIQYRVEPEASQPSCGQ